MEAFYPVLALTAAMFLVFGALSRPLQTSIVTAPMLCVAAGVAASHAFNTHAHISLDNPVIGAVGEVALAIVLLHGLTAAPLAATYGRGARGRRPSLDRRRSVRTRPWQHMGLGRWNFRGVGGRC
ncbi:MAG: hypothetical protein WCA12_09275 [Burkholderiales bacterium]